MLQRHLGSPKGLLPGQWCSEPARHVFATMIPVSLCCPGCGVVDELAATFKVDVGGRVTPAWSCSTGNCPLLEHIQLTGWGEPIP